MKVKPKYKRPRHKPIRTPVKASDRVLSLDVSSTAAGYAIVHGSGNVAVMGVAKPKASLPSLDRIREIVEALEDVYRQHKPDLIVMEWSNGKVAGRINARASGLAVLGQAQGVAYGVLSIRDVPIECVGENEWTCQRPKNKRAEEVALLVPAYRTISDAGLDAADAVGLALWYTGHYREHDA